MSQELHTESEASATQLLSGILADAQDLLRQQLALFRAEVREDIHKTKQAVYFLVGGLIIVHAAAIVLCFTAVYALAQANISWPLWISFGIVGGVLAIVGGVLAAVSIAKFRSFNPLPDQTVAAAQENVRWIANPK
jgi:MFS-type transporter involved in bile tolerance (Atg22 family)